MLEILKFIFSNFWTFMGTFLTVGVIFASIGSIGRKTIYRYNRPHVNNCEKFKKFKDLTPQQQVQMLEAAMDYEVEED